MSPKADAGSASAEAPRRKDAEENRRRILEATPHALGADPAASMEDIAKAAGLSRRTVYGHFANRDALIVALAEAVQGELVALIEGADADGDSPPDRYARFLMRMWQDPERLRLLTTIARAALGNEGPRAVMAPVNAKVAEFVATGQADGTFDDLLPATALARSLQAIGFTLVEEFGAGRWDGDAGSVAHACLVAAGMDRVAAAELVERLGAD